MSSYGSLEPALKLVGEGDVERPSPAEREALAERLQTYKLAAKSEATRSAYESDWRHFAAWCQEQGHEALPAEPVTLDLYLAHHAESLKPSTLARRLVAISRIHKAAGYNPPTSAATVRDTFQGICRTQGTAPAQKTPLLIEDLRRILPMLDLSTPLGLRDRALLLIGFAGGFRASEIGGILAADIQPTGKGVIITIRKSKTDQRGEGQRVGIPTGQEPETCPVAALKDWVTAAKITKGPVFRPLDRHGNVRKGAITRFGVSFVVKRCVKLIGLDPAGYGGHSLRAGLATSAAQHGASERAIMKTTRHKSEKMARRYIRDSELFRDNAASATGL